jgi:pyridoxine/pyridoxamine 5'-phosphate oxidase
MSAAGLDQLLEEIWDALETGAVGAKNALHVPAVSTLHLGRPLARHVVLQRVDRVDGVVGFNTDARRETVRDLRAEPAISWLFYDPARKLQVRLEGVASVHSDDAVADSAWAGVTPLGRRCYGQMPAPGELLGTAEAPDITLADYERLRAQDPAEVAAARVNFCAVQCRVYVIDYLYLRYRGHLRARFERSGEEWAGVWLAP